MAEIDKTVDLAAKKKKATQKDGRLLRALEATPHAGLNFGPRHHVFIAKAKRGEVWSLNHLSVVAKSAVTPLLEMWPPKALVKAPKVPKTFATHTADVLQVVAEEWGQLPMFLDPRYCVAKSAPTATTVQALFQIAQQKNLTVVPVTRLQFSPAVQIAIRDAVQLGNRGVMVRLFTTDFTDVETLRVALNGLLNVLGVTPQQVDILIDLESKADQMQVETLGKDCLTKLPSANRWRTLTLASGSFPESISDLPHDAWHVYPRADWLGFLAAYQAQRASNSRLPSFGDYGVRCGGEPVEIPNGPAPNLRYSSHDTVIVRRSDTQAGKMKAICSSLVTRTEFTANLSQGDISIAEKAATPGQTKNGSAEQWIQWSTNHHLELASGQIRNLPVS